jgi:uncharacterized protein (TIGR01319 family)
MKVEVLSAEIGSTITVVSAFTGLTGFTEPQEEPRFLGQGFAPTSVEDGDVRIGLEAAVENLKKNLGASSLEWEHFFAASSAAGGLRMSVHGLVHDMTVKAAREAALGAGANISFLTAGPLRDSDLGKIKQIRPNIILIAGGVDYGERDTALNNARAISALLTEERLFIPVIYAGNIENHDEIREIFPEHRFDLRITGNVYPRIDQLEIGPARKVIQDLFEQHITRAPGMEHIRDIVDGSIMPVPGAVMQAAAALREELGDLVVFDIGGATTDVHSVCSDSPEVEKILLAPEPEAKRTVEGDLGLYVNRVSLLNRSGIDRVAKSLGLTDRQVEEMTAGLGPIPVEEGEYKLVRELTYHAARIALSRHAGVFRDMYGISGKQRYAEGKDLTGIRRIIGTGGALTRLRNGRELIRRALESGDGRALFPRPDTEILIDTQYIMASAGILASKYPQAAVKLLLDSFKTEEFKTKEGPWAHPV